MDVEEEQNLRAGKDTHNSNRCRSLSNAVALTTEGPYNLFLRRAKDTLEE